MKKLTSIILGWWYLVSNKNNYVAQERLKVCMKCEHRKFGICNICGCVLQAKARLWEEECPIHKWPYEGIHKILNETSSDL